MTAQVLGRATAIGQSILMDLGATPPAAIELD